MTEAHLHLTAPSPFVARFASLVPGGGTVLDLAAGRGRHARFFAARGHPVLAVDRDLQALASLEGLERVKTLCADLEGGPWPCGSARFEAVVVTNYLHRPLFGTIEAALAEGGVLLYETFMRGQERWRKPSRPEFLLEPGELLRAFPALSVIAFEQGRVEAPFAAVVQRLCAVKGRGPQVVLLPEGQPQPASGVEAVR